MEQGRVTSEAKLTPTPLLETFPSLSRNRNFLLLFGSYVVSVLGDRVHFLVMLQLLCIVILGQKAADTRHFAELNLAMFVPFLLLAPLAGVIADRLPRRRIMITCDLSRAVLVIIARTVLLAGAIHHWLSMYQLLWLLFGSEVVLSLFGEMFSPARAAILPNLVHPQQLLRANSWMNPAGTIVTLIGFLLGGWLVIWRLDDAMYVDACTYILSAVCVMAMRVPPGVDQPGGSGVHQRVIVSLRQGGRYLRNHTRPLQAIGLELAFFTVSSVIFNSLPSLVHRRFGLGNGYLYLTMALTGLGMIVGALVLSRAKENIPKEIGIAWSVVLIGVGLLLAGKAESWLGLVIWLMVAACFGSVMFISVDTLLQRILPDYVRGRVMGVRDLITTAGIIVVTITMAVTPDVDTLVVRMIDGVGVGTLLLGLSLVFYYYRAPPLPLGQTIALRILRVYMVLWHGWRRIGPCRIPGRGPVIVAANHRSGLDPVSLLISSPRRLIRFMVALEYYQSPVVGRIIRFGESVPVDRAAPDAASFRAALRVLCQGGVLGIFPEGQISLDGQLQPAKLGIAALALLGRATVVPVYMDCRQSHHNLATDFVKPARARIYYGRPMDFSRLADKAHDRQVLNEITREIMAAITAIKVRAEALPTSDAPQLTRNP